MSAVARARNHRNRLASPSRRLHLIAGPVAPRPGPFRDFSPLGIGWEWTGECGGNIAIGLGFPPGPRPRGQSGSLSHPFDQGARPNMSCDTLRGRGALTQSLGQPKLPAKSEPGIARFSGRTSVKFLPAWLALKPRADGGP